MPLIKIKGVKAYSSKGKVYAYHRASGTQIKATYGSPEFFAELKALNDKHTTQPSNGGGPGTWGALVTEYKGSTRFRKELGRRTRSDYDEIFEWLKGIDDMPLSDIDKAFVIDLRDKAHDKKNWHFANAMLTAMGAVFTWAGDRKKAPTHPVRGVKRVKRPKGKPRANRPWAKDEWTVVVQSAPKHLLAPILLFGVLGWREGEAIARPVTDYDRTNKTIKRISSKNGKEVRTPVPAVVAAALDALLPHDAITLLVNSRGRPWTEDGFRASFFKFIRKLETEGKVGRGLTAHGLRHTCATVMKELGVPKELRKEWLGQNSDGMAEWYSRDADMQQQFSELVKKIDEGVL